VCRPGSCMPVTVCSTAEASMETRAWAPAGKVYRCTPHRSVLVSSATARKVEQVLDHLKEAEQIAGEMCEKVTNELQENLGELIKDFKKQQVTAPTVSTPPARPTGTMKQEASSVDDRWEASAMEDSGPTKWASHAKKLSPQQAEDAVLKKYGKYFEGSRAEGLGAAARTQVLSGKDYSNAVFNKISEDFEAKFGREMTVDQIMQADRISKRQLGCHFKSDGSIFINADKATPETAYHEVLHDYAAPAWKRQVSTPMDEAVTQWLSRSDAAEQGIGFSETSYKSHVKAIDMYTEGIPRETIEKAYFQGDVEGLKAAIDEAKGPGKYDELQWILKKVNK